MGEIGLNFRATSGYVTDGADETYVLGDLYPTTRGGFTFGWSSSPNGNRDRSTSSDRRLAGINFTSNGTQRTFRLDLGSSGEKNIRLALGDATTTQANQYCQFLDDTTVISTIDKSETITAGNFYDATGTVYSAANWPGSNTAINYTFSSSILNLKLGRSSGSDFTVTAHLFFEDAGGPPSTILPIIMNYNQKMRS